MEIMTVDGFIVAFIAAMGIPSGVFGLILWDFKRKVEKRDKEREEREAKKEKEDAEREANYEKIMLMIMQTGRANYVLSVASAKAIQRIPDAQCNGDMKNALKEAEEMQAEEQAFLMRQGIKRIFGEQ